MGFFQGFLAVTLMIFSIVYLKAYQYGTISYLEPVVASLAGLVLYDETITLQQALGGILILSSGVTQILLAVKDTR
jgi:drug/metabolite transporter (DMT)-like permease